MAIRLATLATVPVKRVCIAVKPVSKGDCAKASAGKRISRVKRLRPGRILRRLPPKAARNRRLCVRVAIIGTSSGPDWAAICRERKPDPRPTSNNFLGVGYNFLDFEGVIRLARLYLDVRISK